MINLILKNYVVNFEREFTENGIEKIETRLTLNIKNEEDVDDIFPCIQQEIIVINLNSQTGKEMDVQRLKEANDFVTNFTI